MRQGPEWTTENVSAVLTALDWYSSDQARVIRYAATHNGRITRQEIDQICGPQPDAEMRQFARPVERIVHEMTVRGRIPNGLPAMLEAVSESDPIQEFRLDEQVTTILNRTVSAPCSFGA